ncbi:Uncharacterized conserved protein YbgA, DUF1722 family [Salimicrobium album]|uniref:Uncharacterized conserved protein YbgA, DUF1722 family n=1 Tax=Salimicrobium album TaxID=50717 RepID=A0A1H3ESI9_9BACI|nr:Uncharacterized conserved protein YbgA, DUF1722 family [Salimicrobium album]
MTAFMLFDGYDGESFFVDRIFRKKGESDVDYKQKPAIYIERDVDISREYLHRLEEYVNITGNRHADGSSSASFLIHASPEDLDDFWTKMFTLHRLRKVFEQESKRRLFDFQSDHKYLLMAYSPGIQKQMGRLLARGRETPFFELAEDYRQLLEKAVETPPTRARHVNACEHIAGHVKRQLSEEEKELLQRKLKQFVDGAISLDEVRALLKDFGHKYEDDYVLSQAYLYPHPFVSV